MGKDKAGKQLVKEAGGRTILSCQRARRRRSGWYGICDIS